MKTIHSLKFKAALLLCLSFFFSYAASAQEKEEQKIEKATTVLSDFAKMKESIPSDCRYTRYHYCT
jgi:hypothetical protein